MEERRFQHARADSAIMGTEEPNSALMTRHAPEAETIDETRADMRQEPLPAASEGDDFHGHDSDGDDARRDDSQGEGAQGESTRGDAPRADGVADAGEAADEPGSPEDDDEAGRAARLRRVAAARTGGIAQTAASRGGEIGRVAAGKTGEFGRVAAARGGEIGRVAAGRSAELGRNIARLDVPWARGPSARLLRAGIFGFALGPLIDFYTESRSRGDEQLRALDPPVIFVANHSSHLDAPTILRALPREWRRRTAVAAAADYFYKKRVIANAFALIFNTVPLARRGGGIGKGAIDHVDQLIDQRWNLLMFPEGTRSRDGRIGKLRSGAAVIAAQHDIPIVPIFVQGTHEAMPPGTAWPSRIQGRYMSRRHHVEVRFGEPIRPAAGESPHDVMARVRAYFESQAGPPSEPPPPPRRPRWPTRVT